ncbi:MAG TPA: class I SAM-dependent methyltransferase [Actinomycetota bacterium]|nr:class I SAM-dependent methyltransferase [Actinomycetota bacterium]
MKLFRREGRSAEIPLPPADLMFEIGASRVEEYTDIGNEFMGYFVELASLTPDSDVLDVGCGVGRMALPLTRFLSRRGSYRGFDTWGRSIDWCKENIQSRFRNFRFDLVDIYSKRYNPGGSVKASEFVFPYADDSFDFAALTSVFTHMLPSDLQRYLGELARVLRPGGRCLITYFLLNQESLAAHDRGETILRFPVEKQGYRLANEEIPEEAIAYDETFVTAAHISASLPIQEPIYFGEWTGRKEFLSGQDIVIAKRT